MNAFSHSSNFNPSEELRAIHEKREALLRIVKITQAVERLLKGMQAVLLMGQPAGSIPKQALKAYESLSGKTAMLPTTHLKARLEKLDAHVLGILEWILEHAGIESSLLEQTITDPHEAVKTSDSHTEQMLNEFRRSAQTSVALRILLRERGESSPPLKLTLPQDIIKRQITSLEAREKECRKQIESNIENIQQATQRILQNEDASEEFKATIKLIQDNLQRDLQHIQAGKSIDDLPMIIEVVELQDQYSAEEPEVSPPSKNEQVAVVEGPTNDVPKTTNKSPNRQRVKRGFFGKLFYWISTPLSVKWKDIE